MVTFDLVNDADNRDCRRAGRPRRPGQVCARRARGVCLVRVGAKKREAATERRGERHHCQRHQGLPFGYTDVCHLNPPGSKLRCVNANYIYNVSRGRVAKVTGMLTQSEECDALCPRENSLTDTLFFLEESPWQDTSFPSTANATCAARRTRRG